MPISLSSRNIVNKKTVLTLKKTLLLCAIVTCGALQAREADEEPQVKVGNLAVPGTVQPGAFLGFGQNIITQYEALAVVYPSWFLGKNKSFAEILPYIVYGLRDDLSILLGFPTAIRYKDDGHHSSGSADLIIQLEYSPYSHHMPTVTNQISLVAALLLPTGSDCKNPPTGSGSPSFFLGVTALHLATEWYCYTSYGALLTMQHDNNKSGNQFFYQAGVGKNIAYSPDKWILMWMVELYGWYEQKNKINRIIDQNSGFNMVILGPSLWFSTDRLILQVGAAPVVSQHLFGTQLKNSVLVSCNIGCRFN
ncbi:MAG TPA: hypothetical protein VJJ26_04145 [Candidatus Babeliales bacterium]|nr:hypothetical protein [Candidatus Babeliales bacterium]